MFSFFIDYSGKEDDPAALPCVVWRFMINSEHLCMGCMKEIGEVQQCPHCGFHVETMQMAPYLAVRTVIANRYLVGKLLEYNGDGATYIAWDINDKKPVTIREFLPDTLATRTIGTKEVTVMSGCELSYRECMADFVELWRKLSRMGGLSALVNVYDVIEENSTAYAICEYVKSITLRDYLLRLKTGYITWERARTLFMPVLSTLGMLHTAGIIHRGISPLTLQIGQDGKMRIGGFSIWQARTAKSDLAAQLFPGYAAIEQYGFEGKQGPATDIYAFAATLYRALIGSDPIEATDRLTNDRLMVPGRFAEQLPAYVINGLINALQIMPEERTRTVEQLRADLSASPVAAAASGTEFQTPQNSAPPVAPVSEYQPVSQNAAEPAKKNTETSKNRMIIIRSALISAIVGLLIFLIVLIAFGDEMGLNIGNDKEETEVAEEQTREEKVEVPKFVNRNYIEVINNNAWKNNFRFEKNEAYSDKIEAGIIISQSVEAGSKVNAGVKIVLTVSKGDEMFELSPSIIGMDYEAAAEALMKLKFDVSKEELDNDGTHTEGTVQSVANVAIGQLYPKGTKVTLRVWGPAATTEDSTGSEPESPTDSGNTDTPDEPSTEPSTEPEVTEPAFTEPPTLPPTIVPTEPTV